MKDILNIDWIPNNRHYKINPEFFGSIYHKLRKPDYKNIPNCNLAILMEYVMNNKKTIKTINKHLDNHIVLRIREVLPKGDFSKLTLNDKHYIIEDYNRFYHSQYLNNSQICDIIGKNKYEILTLIHKNKLILINERLIETLIDCEFMKCNNDKFNRTVDLLLSFIKNHDNEHCHDNHQKLISKLVEGCIEKQCIRSIQYLIPRFYKIRNSEDLAYILNIMINQKSRKFYNLNFKLEMMEFIVKSVTFPINLKFEDIIKGENEKYVSQDTEDHNKLYHYVVCKYTDLDTITDVEKQNVLKNNLVDIIYSSFSKEYEEYMTPDINIVDMSLKDLARFYIQYYIKIIMDFTLFYSDETNTKFYLHDINNYYQMVTLANAFPEYIIPQTIEYVNSYYQYYLKPNKHDKYYIQKSKYNNPYYNNHYNNRNRELDLSLNKYIIKKMMNKIEEFVTKYCPPVALSGQV
jgi:hypothetical protein